MKPISKPSAVKLTADALREGCAAGRWAGSLPGTRALAATLGVSAPTVSAAMAKLVEERVLESGGERRAFRVVGSRAPKGVAATGSSTKRLLILTHDDLGQLVSVTRCAVERLRQKMTARGWTVHHQVVDFLHAKNARRAWDRQIRVDEQMSIVAVYGREPLARWALKRQARVLFLGGGTGGLPIPLVAVNSARMAAAAMSRLTALGHSRVVFPLCDRTEDFRIAMRSATRAAIEAAGGVYVQSYHNPESPYLTPEVSWRVLESVFARQAPTALVCLDWKELVTAHCFASRLGLKVPADLSLVLLNDPAEAEWFHPALVRFRIPIRRLVLAVVRWLENDFPDTGPVLLPGEPIAGESVAPARDR